MEDNIEWEEDLSLYEFNQEYFNSTKYKILKDGFLRSGIGSENYTCSNCEYDSNTDFFTYCNNCKNKESYYDIEIVNRKIFYKNLEKILRRLSRLLTTNRYEDYKFIPEFMYVITLGIFRESVSMEDDSFILETYIEGLAKANKELRKVNSEKHE